MKVIIFPASTQTVFGEKIYFVFSVRQVEDIIREIPVSPVPFSPRYLKGIVRWRDCIIPVISMEECLGFDMLNVENANRLLTVRGGDGKKERAMIKTGSGLRMLSLPIPCTPAASSEWIPEKHLVSGVYEWEEGFLICVRIDDILSGTYSQ
ncbi:MAG: hypothetical protein BWK80_55635 [Desulfobacteraceae bacterium IS3]|jgi:chemotaxis signal transduction protein|nr:MAG: hypothetical protein BWK80_55635 [Desulfobacteraceae bacterium IS3]HAO22686.1 hypothetical protein [Desulfobacteraceae bacterium]